MANKKADPAKYRRYNHLRPTLGCRVPREVAEKFWERCEQEGVTVQEKLAAFVEGGIENHDNARRSGFEEAMDRYAVRYPCVHCGGELIVEANSEVMAFVQVKLQEGGWGHGECHQEFKRAQEGAERQKKVKEAEKKRVDRECQRAVQEVTEKTEEEVNAIRVGAEQRRAEAYDRETQLEQQLRWQRAKDEDEVERLKHIKKLEGELSEAFVQCEIWRMTAHNVKMYGLADLVGKVEKQRKEWQDKVDVLLESLNKQGKFYTREELGSLLNKAYFEMDRRFRDRRRATLMKEGVGILRELRKAKEMGDENKVEELEKVKDKITMEMAIFSDY